MMSQQLIDFIDSRTRHPYKSDEVEKFQQEVNELQLPDPNSLPILSEEEKRQAREDAAFRRSSEGLEDAWLDSAIPADPTPIFRDTVELLCVYQSFVKKSASLDTVANFLDFSTDFSTLSTKKDETEIAPDCLHYIAELLFQKKEREVKEKWKKELTEKLKTLFNWPAINPNLKESSKFESFFGFVRSIQSFKDSETGLPLFMQVYITPYVNQFRYHFMSQKQTNVLSKPEWFFEFLLKVFRSNRSFYMLMRDIKFFPGVPPFFTFINLLNNVAKEKLTHIIKYDDYLVHLVHETLQYSVRLEQHFHYTQDPLIIFLFEQNGTYDKWLGLETQLSLTKLEDIKIASDAWELESDQSDDFSSAVPTKMTVRFRDMIETTFSVLQNLPSLDYQFNFWRSVQLKPMMQYVNWLEAFYESHESSSSIHLPGSLQTDKSKFDIAEVERMCKLYSNFKLLMDWLDDIEDEDVYIRIGHKMGSENYAAFYQVKPRLSTLTNGSFRMILRAVSQTLRPLLDNYSDLDTWVIKEQLPGAALLSTSVSAEIVGFQSRLKEIIALLQKLLIGSSQCEAIYQIGTLVESWMIKIVMTHQFSVRGGVQFAMDAMQIVLEFSDYPLLKFERLMSTVELLSLESGENKLIKKLIIEINQKNYDFIDEFFKTKEITLSYEDALGVLYRRVDAWKD